MRLKPFAAALATTLGISLAGCAANNAATLEQATHGYRVYDSKFDKTRKIIGPDFSGKTDGGLEYVASLAAIQSKDTGALDHALSIRWTYRDQRWAFIDRATLPGGSALNVAVVDRNVERCSLGSCVYIETLAVTLPLEEILRHDAPLEIRFGSRRGFADVVIPAVYKKGYLVQVAELSGLNAASKATQQTTK